MESTFEFAFAGGDIYEERGRVFQHAPFQLEQKLIDCVASGDEEGSLAVLAQIERQGAKARLSDEPLRSAKNSVICTITILARAAIRAGVDANEAFAVSDYLIRQIETLRSSNEVLAFEGESLKRFVNLVNSSALSRYSFPVGRAVHYIEVHLSEKITLSDTAKYAQVHPNYLSEIFKKEVGENLSIYFRRRQIHEAAYFVKNRAYRLSDIALLYGFSSQSYFGSIFKKFIGTTPGEYRQSNIA